MQEEGFTRSLHLRLAPLPSGFGPGSGRIAGSSPVVTLLLLVVTVLLLLVDLGTRSLGATRAADSAVPLWSDDLDGLLEEPVLVALQRMTEPFAKGVRYARAQVLEGEDAFQENVADVISRLPVRSYASSISGGAHTPV